MKTRTKLTLAGSLLLAPVLLVVAQQFLDQADAEKRSPVVSKEANSISGYAVDRATWNIFDPNDPSADLSAFNTDEARWKRYKAVLSLEYPEEYAKQFPQSAEEKARSEAGRRIIENPPTLEEVMNGLATEEERKEAVDSLNAMLNPATEESLGIE